MIAAARRTWPAWNRRSPPSDHSTSTGSDCPELRAVIFDVDGTLADTERDGHRPAFNAAFAAHDLDIVWGPEEYGRLLKITGGRRRIAAALSAHGYGYGEQTDRLAARVHRTKTEFFCERIDTLQPRPGLRGFVTSLVGAGIRIGVATTGRRAWVLPLVRQLVGEGTAETVVTGDDVVDLKPDPEVYLRALANLRLDSKTVVAVEDSEIGLRAALAAGIATVVVTNTYTADQDFAGATVVRSAYHRPEPFLADECMRLHAQWWSVAGRDPHVDRQSGQQP